MSNAQTNLEKHNKAITTLIANWSSYNKKMYALPTDTYGIWRVCGEDPNCDFSGSHIEPLLGYFQGTLEDVMHYAVDLPGWMGWGSGGSISQVLPQKVDPQTIITRKTRLAEIERLEKKLAELKKQP